MSSAASQTTDANFGAMPSYDLDERQELFSVAGSRVISSSSSSENTQEHIKRSLSLLTVAQLKEQCKKMGISVTGNE